LTHTWRWARRHPATTSLIAASVLVVVLVIGGIFVWLDREAGHKLLIESGERLHDQQEAARTLRSVQARWAYDLNVLHASLAVERGDLSNAQAFLMKAREEARAEPLAGWEWRYLQRRTDAEVATLPISEGKPRAAAWSPDGRILAIGTSA